MEKLTSLNLDFNKILIQIVIPGIVASTPYVYIYLYYHVNAKEYLYKNPTSLTLLLTIISLIVGMIMKILVV